MIHGKVLRMRTCRVCGVEKDATAYGPDRRVADGLQARCRECIRATNRYVGARAEYNRINAIERYYRLQREAHTLLGNACRTCGEADPEVLELDHVNEDGHLEGRNRGGTKIYPQVIADPSRFQLLCANCHRRKTRAASRLRRVV